MLEKTMELLRSFGPGAYVAEASSVFDEAEIRDLASKLQPMLYAPAPLRARLQQYGVSITPANFYAEVPSIEEIEDPRGHGDTVFNYGFDADRQRAFLEELLCFSEEFDPPRDGRDGAFGWNNDQFSYSDAMTYYCLIRSRRPAHIVEIGSGWSSLVAREALRRNGAGRLTCIEPYPSDMLRAAEGIELVASRAQDLSTDDLNAKLQAGDFLFIDSTHTVKHNSDCIHIYLRLLPEITHDILVHAHDIRLPGTLSVEMMRDSQIYWTEQYLLYAYLLDNPRCELLFGSQFAHKALPEVLASLMHDRWPAGGASVWFSQRTRGSAI